MPDPAMTPISQRECDQCRKATDRTIDVLQTSIADIAAARVEDAKRIDLLGAKIDAVALDVKEIQTILQARREADRGLWWLAAKAAPWLIAALLGGGGLYRATQAPDPAAIAEAVRQLQDAAPSFSAKP